MISPRPDLTAMTCPPALRIRLIFYRLDERQHDVVAVVILLTTWCLRDYLQEILVIQLDEHQPTVHFERSFPPRTTNSGTIRRVVNLLRVLGHRAQVIPIEVHNA